MSEPLIVIGITGVAGSGKDTAAGILSQRHGFFRIAMADGVRSAFRDLDGITWGLTKELEKAGLGARWALQRLGGDAREKVAEACYEGFYASDDLFDYESAPGHYARLHANRFWCYLALAKIQYLHSIHPVPRSRFVIPDISYLHEVNTLSDVVRELGGTYATWRIDRPGAGLQGDAARHASEVGRATIPADLTIANDGSIADLERRIEDAILSRPLDAAQAAR